MIRQKLVRLFNWARYDLPARLGESPSYQGFCFFLLRLLLKLPSHRLRKYVLRRSHATIGQDVALYAGLEVRNPSGLVVSDGSSIGHNCILDARRGLEIGRHVNLSSEVMIWTLSHDYNSPHFALKGGKVTIGDYAWLGPRTIILPNVRIGDYAVVAAGSVVTKNVPPHTVVAGIPAQVIRERDMSQTYQYVPGRNYLRFC